MMTPLQLDILRELINIGIGQAAGVLNQMTRTHIRLSVPELLILTPETVPVHCLLADVSQLVSAIELPFQGPFTGMAVLAFPIASAGRLVSIVVGEESPSGVDMDSLRLATLQEIGNIVLNGVMGSLGNILGHHLDYLPVEYFEDSFEHLIQSIHADQTMVLFIRAHFDLEGGTIGGDILIFFRLGSFDILVRSIESMAGN